MGERAFVLPRFPVEVEGADSAELGEGCIEDDYVDVVAEINPDDDEEAEIRANDGGVQIIECF